MHAALKLFQVFAPQGAVQCGKPQKIAVKLQVKDEMPVDGNTIDFNALLASQLPGQPWDANPGRVDNPLENLDWLPLDQSLMDQSTPVIDLTNPEADNEAALQMLVTLAMDMGIPNGKADIGNQTRQDHPALMERLQPVNWIAASDRSAAQDASAALLQADFRNSEGKGGNGRTAPDLKAILPDVGQKGATDSPAGLSQKMDASQENGAEALKAVAERLAPAAQNGDKNTLPGHASADHASLSGIKSSEEHTHKTMLNLAEQAMPPSHTRSDDLEEDHESLKHTLLSPNRIQAESSPGQQGFHKYEENQDAQDFRHTVLHDTRAQAIISSRTKDEPAQPPRDMQTDVIRQIVARMTLRGDSGRPEMQIKLKPEFLGDLRLHITTENQHVMVRITADSPAVKEMIEQNLQFLKSELQQHGLQIDKFDVFVGQENEAWKHRQQQNGSHDARRGRQRFSVQGKLDAPEEPEAHRISGQMPKHSQIGMKEVDFFA